MYELMILDRFSSTWEEPDLENQPVTVVKALGRTSRLEI